MTASLIPPPLSFAFRIPFPAIDFLASPPPFSPTPPSPPFQAWLLTLQLSATKSLDLIDSLVREAQMLRDAASAEGSYDVSEASRGHY